MKDKKNNPQNLYVQIYAYSESSLNFIFVKSPAVNENAKDGRHSGASTSAVFTVMNGKSSYENPKVGRHSDAATSAVPTPSVILLIKD